MKTLVISLKKVHYANRKPGEKLPVFYTSLKNTKFEQFVAGKAKKQAQKWRGELMRIL